jgi:type 1 glutamine amidotransferase
LLSSIGVFFMCLSRGLFSRGLLALVTAAFGATVNYPAPLSAADAPKRLLFVTHSGGFIHDSVGTAEDVLNEIGPKNGFEVTCYRWTNDTNTPAFEKYQEQFRARTGKTVGLENTGRINKETLRNFDCVLFFTTGNPMTVEETKDLIEWVRAGGAFAGTHCATDTLYGDAAYGNLIGAYFAGHPPGLQTIRVRVEDPNHPAAAGFTDGQEYRDEMYVFRSDPYSRDRLRVILSIAKGSFNPGGRLVREDDDYAISWVREEGKGRVFYTSFGHDKKVWQDADHFQKHLIGGLKWATGQVPGDATPSAKR